MIIANAYAYVLATTVPLPEADAWRFLGGFLGRYIEGHMSLLDFFSQDKQGETNQPFYKLILLFHTHFFDMDFSIEGLFGLTSAVLLLVTLMMLALSDGPRRFTAGETALAIALVMVLLSLDAPIVFAWGLASLWFMPILLTVLYLGYATGLRANRFGLLAASAVLGVLLDEVAFVGFVATAGSLLLVRRRLQRSIPEAVCYAGAGIVLSRVFYWMCGFFAGPATPDASAVPRGSLLPRLMSPDCWKAVVVPLSDSLVQPANLKLLLGSAAPA
ncbi:MAG: hypothetical protein JWL98_1345, partial [Xanthomonadaceae bacterium]|nr:hypothetical protein [Xanthomonadaceae bacterium]